MKSRVIKTGGGYDIDTAKEFASCDEYYPGNVGIVFMKDGYIYGGPFSKMKTDGFKIINVKDM